MEMTVHGTSVSSHCTIVGGCRLRHPPGHDTRNVLVFDLGGGTFDTVLLQRTKDVIRVCICLLHVH
jgi:hypothetical protein